MANWLFHGKSSLYIYIKYIEYGLVRFYGISTIVGYLMPNPVFYIYIKYIGFGLVKFYGISTIAFYLMPNPFYTYLPTHFQTSLRFFFVDNEIFSSISI